MDQTTSEAEITSCYEMEQERFECARRDMELAEDVILQSATEEIEELTGEKNVLSMELQSELESVNRFSAALDEAHQASRDHLMQMLEMQTQLTNVNKDLLNQFSTLQELREQNHIALRDDPICALILEERELQKKLNDIGYYVYPPTGSESNECE